MTQANVSEDFALLSKHLGTHTKRHFCRFSAHARMRFVAMGREILLKAVDVLPKEYKKIETTLLLESAFCRASWSGRHRCYAKHAGGSG